MLFSKLLPKEGNFFELFNQHADRIVEAARAFEKLVSHYGDLQLRAKYNQEVDDAERAADRVTHEVNRLIHTTFITPIDREQIHGLINLMDDVADLLQDSAETMALYDVHHMTEEITRLTDLSVKCCERVQAAVRLLGKIAQQNVAEATLKTCEEIDREPARRSVRPRSNIVEMRLEAGSKPRRGDDKVRSARPPNRLRVTGNWRASNSFSRCCDTV